MSLKPQISTEDWERIFNHVYNKKQDSKDRIYNFVFKKTNCEKLFTTEMVISYKLLLLVSSKLPSVLIDFIIDKFLNKFCDERRKCQNCNYRKNIKSFTKCSRCNLHSCDECVNKNITNGGCSYYGCNCCCGNYNMLRYLSGLKPVVYSDQEDDL